jgi:diacylglycerol kinase (ATP)
MHTDKRGDQPRRVAVVINPRSGSSRHHVSADERRAEAERLFRDHGIEPVVLLTEHAGHARELARAALRDGLEWVFAWGGDGTVNEVASVLAFSAATMSVIPSGSGNGLAREFGIPRPPDQAVRAAVEGRDTTIDAGEIDGRLFFNVAGIGFDAHVAHCFSAAVGGRRGAVPYFWTTVREALRYRPQPMTIDAGGEPILARPLLVAIANGRQWGSGARIAPRALPDDGLLELVVVSGRWPPATLLSAWRLFTGTFDRSSIARSLAVESFTIHSDVPVAIHVDGEPIGQRTDVIVRVRPSALKLRIPRHRRQ